jgi:hypothetical protein
MDGDTKENLIDNDCVFWQCPRCGRVLSSIQRHCIQENLACEECDMPIRAFVPVAGRLEKS